jgi:hypothetical protein
MVGTVCHHSIPRDACDRDVLRHGAVCPGGVVQGMAGRLHKREVPSFLCVEQGVCVEQVMKLRLGW